MSPGITIGIDVATAHIRAVALDPGGVDPVFGPVEASLSSPVRGGQGEVSQTPDYALVARDVMGKLIAGLGQKRASAITSLCVTATSGTLVPCDDQGQPLGDALMYNDQRGDSAVRDRVMEHVADRPSPSIGRLWWIATHTRATQVLSPADVILADLAGGHVVPADTSHHLKSAIDPLALTWPEALIDALGVSRSLLPELVRSGVVVGYIAPSIAKELGVGPDVALVSGMTDGCTSQISTGGIALGDTVGVLGTTLVIKATSKSPVTDPERGVYSHVSPDGHFLPGGASNVGVGSLPPELVNGDRSILHQAIETAGTSGLASTVHYPLPGRGERFPFHQPGAQALWAGTPTSMTDRVRSVMEGVGFIERLGLETLAEHGASSTRHFLSGGGSKSAAWNQLRASILGTSVLVPRYSDSAVGAALLASATHSRETVADLARAVLPEPTIVEPREDDHAALDDRYHEMRTLLESAGYIAPRAD